MESSAVPCSSADQAIICDTDSNGFGYKQNNSGTQSRRLIAGALSPMTDDEILLREVKYMACGACRNDNNKMSIIHNSRTTRSLDWYLNMKLKKKAIATAASLARKDVKPSIKVSSKSTYRRMAEVSIAMKAGESDDRTSELIKMLEEQSESSDSTPRVRLPRSRTWHMRKPGDRRGAVQLTGLKPARE